MVGASDGVNVGTVVGTFVAVKVSDGEGVLVPLSTDSREGSIVRVGVIELGEQAVIMVTTNTIAPRHKFCLKYDVYISSYPSNRCSPKVGTGENRHLRVMVKVLQLAPPAT